MPFSNLFRRNRAGAAPQPGPTEEMTTSRAGGLFRPQQGVSDALAAKRAGARSATEAEPLPTLRERVGPRPATPESDPTATAAPSPAGVPAVARQASPPALVPLGTLLTARNTVCHGEMTPSDIAFLGRELAMSQEKVRWADEEIALRTDMLRQGDAMLADLQQRLTTATQQLNEAEGRADDLSDTLRQRQREHEEAIRRLAREHDQAVRRLEGGLADATAQVGRLQGWIPYQAAIDGGGDVLALELPGEFARWKPALLEVCRQASVLLAEGRHPEVHAVPGQRASQPEAVEPVAPMAAAQARAQHLRVVPPGEAFAGAPAVAVAGEDLIAQAG